MNTKMIFGAGSAVLLATSVALWAASSEERDSGRESVHFSPDSPPPLAGSLAQPSLRTQSRAVEPKPLSADSGSGGSKAALAEQRYQEMLSRMQRSIEDIAQLYGNPLFVQLFTNDPPKAEEFRRRLALSEGTDELRARHEELIKRRDELAKVVALQERESASMGERLARQRAALDSVVKAVEAAQRAIEGSGP